MAVYTQVDAVAIAHFLDRYDCGTIVSAKGIAEGVENTNYFVDTTRARFILTLYEKRVDVGDLPFFLALTGHLADKGCPVPRVVADREGVQIQQLAGRTACLIEFVPGVSVTVPTPAQARSAGAAMAQMHTALRDFRGERRNALGLAEWHALAARCGGDLDRIAEGLRQRVADELRYLDAHWPRDLPVAVIHADMFPDNVLLRGDVVSGVIDFYFACSEVRAYDMAVAHSAWSFSNDGAVYDAAVGDALLAGYEAGFGMSDAERAALPVLARGACLRFLLTRAWDWLNTPADAMVNRKDPLAFLRRLDHYAAS